MAIAKANGLPVLPGIVVTTDAPADAAFSLWYELSAAGTRPLAVRSSSPVEDQASSSMAGHFTSVLDVIGWDATQDAVARVRASAHGGPMAVLLQPMCDAVTGGVLFGVDPVTGNPDRLVLELVDGGPDALVSGIEIATRHVLTRRGRLVDGDELDRRIARRVVHLARDAGRVFGAPQDIELAIDDTDTLWLLQSRPVTAVASRACGPRLGPGPIAETFPEPLSPLELDLWLEPLRAGVAEALSLVAVHPRRAVARSPVVVDVDGRVAADLDLLEPTTTRGLLRKVDPRPGARRLGAAWRVGRLRRALPLLARDVVRAVDAELAAVPSLHDLDDHVLLALLGRSRLTLRALHGHEVLAGILLPGAGGGTGLDHAIHAIGRARAHGVDDDDIVAGAPVVLALVAPRIAAAPELPATVPSTMPPEALSDREALRLRARWVQELSGRAAAVLGERLSARGALHDGVEVRWLTLEELVAMVGADAPAPADLWHRLAGDAPPPLPAAFRLSADGSVVADRAGSTGGTGAGGGRGAGIVSAIDDASGVLVVRTLDPRLAPRLAGRAGLVAETGSVLSHLAIVARELGVPTVVGVPDAVERFPLGARVLVDGTTGEVEVLT